jgi:hypothetical protein
MTPRLEYSYIGRFESLDRDLAWLVERIPPACRVALPRPGNATGAAQLAEDYYTETISRRVQDIYADDYAAFGYQGVADHPGRE